MCGDKTFPAAKRELHEGQLCSHASFEYEIRSPGELGDAIAVFFLEDWEKNLAGSEAKAAERPPATPLATSPETEASNPLLQTKALETVSLEDGLSLMMMSRYCTSYGTLRPLPRKRTSERSSRT